MRMWRVLDQQIPPKPIVRSPYWTVLFLPKTLSASFGTEPLFSYQSKIVNVTLWRQRSMPFIDSPHLALALRCGIHTLDISESIRIISYEICGSESNSVYQPSVLIAIFLMPLSPKASSPLALLLTQHMESVCVAYTKKSQVRHRQLNSKRWTTIYTPLALLGF